MRKILGQEERWKLLGEIRAGKICESCGQPFAPEEIVYRVRLHMGPYGFGNTHSVLACCEDCGVHHHSVGQQTKCVTCGRPMHQVRDHTGLYDTCCQACAKKIHKRNARKQKAKAKRRLRQWMAAEHGHYKCKVCGETLEPLRNGARTCSSACRQKAYRRRQALQLSSGRGAGNTG